MDPNRASKCICSSLYLFAFAQKNRAASRAGKVCLFVTYCNYILFFPMKQFGTGSAVYGMNTEYERSNGSIKYLSILRQKWWFLWCRMWIHLTAWCEYDHPVLQRAPRPVCKVPGTGGSISRGSSTIGKVLNATITAEWKENPCCTN